jgi:hypothetical protein
MTKYFKIGPEYYYQSYNSTEGNYLDGTTSYGVISGGEITLAVGQTIEIDYRYINLSGNSYFLDAATGDNRGYIYVSSTGVITDGPHYTNVQIDGAPATNVPSDLAQHTLSFDVNTGGVKIYNVGQRYNSTERLNATIEDVRIDGVSVGITWTNTVSVGGESGPVLTDHYESLALFASAKDSMVDTDSYHISWFESNITITTPASVNIDLSGEDIIFDGLEASTINDGYSDDTITIIETGGGDCIFRNISSVNLVTTKNTGRAFIINTSNSNCFAQNVGIYQASALQNVIVLLSNGRGDVKRKNILKKRTINMTMEIL